MERSMMKRLSGGGTESPHGPLCLVFQQAQAACGGQYAQGVSPCDSKCNNVQGLISLEVPIDMEGGLLPLHKPKVMCRLSTACFDVM